MIDRIIKPTSKQTVDAILSGDFSVVDKIKAAAKKDARQVFNAVSSGAVSLIWYDLPPGADAGHQKKSSGLLL